HSAALGSVKWSSSAGGACTLKKGGILRQIPVGEPGNAQPISAPSCPQRPLFRLYLRFPADSGQSLSAPPTSPSKDFNMVWLSAIGCLAIGIVIGFIISGRTKAAPSKLTDLEKQLEELQNSHNRYREEVSSHFSMTAELVQQMTDSYRDVYQHLATGAQELC